MPQFKLLKNHNSLKSGSKKYPGDVSDEQMKNLLSQQKKSSANNKKLRNNDVAPLAAEYGLQTNDRQFMNKTMLNKAGLKMYPILHRKLAELTKSHRNNGSTIKNLLKKEIESWK